MVHLQNIIIMRSLSLACSNALTQVFPSFFLGCARKRACKLVHTTHTYMQACAHNTHIHASLCTQHTHTCKLVHTTHTCAHTHTHTHTCKHTLVSWSVTSLLSVADQNESPKCQPTAWSVAQCRGHCLCDYPEQVTSSTSACSMSACVELG